MKRIGAFLVIFSVILLLAGLTEAQVFADFEDGAAGTQGFAKFWGDALLNVQQAADPTANSAGVLELQCDASQGDTKAAVGIDPLDLGWTESNAGAKFLTFDVYVPADFPENAIIKVWAQVAEGSWQWTDFKFSINSEGDHIVAGQWNTIHYPILYSMMLYPEFKPWLHIKGGLEIYFGDGQTWTGSVLVDNATLWGVEPKTVADFENADLGTQGFAKGWGDALLSVQQTADPTAASTGVLELQMDASQGDTKGAIALDPLDLLWTPDKQGAGFITFDVFIPADFPTNAIVKVWAQIAEGSWQWTDYKFSIAGEGQKLIAGQWNTIHYPVLNAMNLYPNFQPWLHVKGGLEVYFGSGQTWTGSVLVDNVQLHTTQVGKKWLVADFEKESAGTQDFNNTGWNQAMTGIHWAADPTGRSTGVLETVWDPSLDVKAQFARDPIDLQWTETDTGATLITFDIWIPDDFPIDAVVGFWMQDKTNWQWTEYKYSLADSSLEAGKWNTITYDVLNALETWPNFYVYGQVYGGIQILFSQGTTWTGSVYFDNFTLYGVEPPAGTLEAPGVTSVALDTLENGEMVATVHWDDISTNLQETYNVYASSSPITDLMADGVIRIGSKIPRGTQEWNHRPYTSDGSDVTYYYAVTATGLDGTETELVEGVSNTGPVTMKSSVTAKAPFVTDFPFEIDGDLGEFEEYEDFAILPESASGPAGGDWDPTSIDLNFIMYFVIDNDYLYFGANVTDDDPFRLTQAWEGDAAELFMGFYPIATVKKWHTKGDIYGSATADYRISFTANNLLQKGGSSNWDFGGIEFGVDRNPIGYVIEARMSLDSLKAPEGERLNPQIGDMLPLRIDVNDQDSLDVYGFPGRTLQLHWGGVGNPENWLRPSCWGYLEVANTTDVPAQPDAGVIKETRLFSNYPNPFNPTTTISYDLATSSDVKLIVYDVLGREVRTLVNHNQASGSYSVVWDGLNNSGQSVGAGVYFVRMTAGQYHKIQKMILVK